MLFKLNLDHDNVYWGAAEIAEAAVKDGDVILDHAPDNAPGRYAWNAEAKRLDALPPSQVKSAPGAPSFEMALHSLMQSLEDAGHAIPATAAAWRDHFRKTLDSKE